MTRTPLRNAAAFAAVLMAVGTAGAAESTRTAPGNTTTLAEMKRSLDRMPIAAQEGMRSATAAPPGRSLSQIKRDVDLTSAAIPTAVPVPLSGTPLAKAKRL